MFKFLKNLFKGSERTYLSSSEYCSLGHPDRLADLCAAIVIDDIQHKDGANSHAAIEVFITHDTVTFGGEAKTTLTIDNKYLRSVVSKAFHRAGYISEMRKYWTKEEACLPSNVSIYNKIEAQSPDIARATTDKQEESGYNDQGIAMSSSENTNNLCLGTPHLLAKLISDELHKVSRESILKPVYYPAVLGPDNKVVVTVKVKEDGFTPIEVTAVTIAVAHSSDSSEDIVKRFAKQVADRVIYDCKIPMAENVKWTVNGTGRFVIHGNISDCSMTGRKLSVNNPSAGPLWSNKLLGGGCIPEGTLVRTPNGEVPIEELNRGNKVLVRGVEHSVTNSFYSGLKSCVKIKTKDGHCLECSEDHKVKVATADNFVFKRAKDLEEGDRLCIDLSNCFGNKKMFAPYVYGALLGDGYYCYNRDSLVLYYPEFDKDSKLVQEFHKVFPNATVGHIEREGYLDEYYLRTTVADKEARENILAQDYTACGAQNKHIYEEYFTVADKESVAEMLRGLFDTDGSISAIYGRQSSVRITFSSASEQLVIGIQYLLAKFGIKSRIRKSDTSEYESNIAGRSIKSCGIGYKLSVYGKDSIKLFLSEIGFKLERNKVIAEVLQYQESDRSLVFGIRNVLLDSYQNISEFRDFCKEFRLDSLRKFIQQGPNEKTGYGMSKDKVSQLLNCSALSNIHPLINEALIYQYAEIESITESGIKECFDIEVSDVNEYVASGISVHNSLVKPFHASDLMLNVGSRLVSNVIVKAGLSSYAVTLISCSIGATKPQSVQIIGDDYFMKHYYKICQDYFTNSFDWSISGLVSYLHILDEGFSFADCVANNFFGDPKSQPWDNNDYIAPMAERLIDYLGLK